MIDLVRADVGQDAATLGRIEEPVGAQVAIEPVRPEADRLHHPAIAPCTSSAARVIAHLEALEKLTDQMRPVSAAGT